MKTGIRNLIIITAVVVLSTTVAACKQKAESLSFVVIPDGDSETALEMYKPLVEYLSEKSNRPIEITVATEYATVVEAIRQNHAQGGRLGPFTLISALNQDVPIQPLVVEKRSDGSISYKCVMIARADRGITEFDWSNVGEYTLGLVDPSSTSGSLIPQAEGLNHGVTLEDWGSYTWTGGHPQSILAVKNGDVDIAFVSDRRWERALSEGTIEEGELVILWSSGPITNSPWVIRTDVDEQTINALATAFETVPEQIIAKSEGFFEGFSKVSVADYDYIASIAEQMEGLTQ